MCPDENTLIRFAHGEAGSLPALEAHLDTCDACRRAVAAAASTQTLPAAPRVRDLSPGERVGRYEVERELGRGGMGVVYQARDVTLDRRVALKLLHARHDARAQARLLREAQVMAKLAHPHVVPVFELGEWQQGVYLAMELVNGVTLEAWLKREKHSARDIIDHFVSAGRGLAAAHAAGVVHRDFKPANVLVGVDGRVRVTDFGLSRPGPSLELPATDSAVVTRDGAIVGTLAYMAPEQLDGRAAEERSDQFAFCVALVEALQGTRPFEGDSWTQLSQSLGERPRLSGVPVALRGVLRRGLAREPARRFASMTALLSALERARRRTWPGWVGVGVTAALAAAFFVSWRPGGEAPAPAVVVQQEALVPVVFAARDIQEGTVVTFEMLEQRAMPERFVTTSSVKPDQVSYIIDQKLQVPVQKGDPLLWSQFQPPTVAAAQQDVPVVVAGADLAKGTVLTPELLTTRGMPKGFVTDSIVPAEELDRVLGQAVTVDTLKGDAVLWTHVVPKKPDVSGEVDQGSVMSVVTRHKDELATCADQMRADGTELIVVRWDIATSGRVEGARVAKPANVAKTEGAACLVKVFEGMRFPPQLAPVRGVSFPIRALPPAP